MEDIEDCFVKFFLKQAVEIEPTSIQSLIDHGYKTKISLLAMDLVLDLPQINDIPMAQRSILRKYIGTLQEFSPFSLSIDEVALKKYHEPNKKRKYEAIHDSDNDEFHSPKSSVSSPRGKVAKATTSSNISFNGIVLPSTISPLKPKRLSIKYVHEKNHQAQRDVEMFEEPKDDESQDDDFEIKDTPPRIVRGRNGRQSTKKKEVLRTQSQIRYEKLKEQLAAAISPTKSEESNEDDNDVLIMAPLPRTTNRRSAAVAKTRISIAPPARRTSVVPKSVDTTPAGPIPTQAELAIRAKIEAKKQAQAEGKQARGRTRSKK